MRPQPINSQVFSQCLDKPIEFCGGGGGGGVVLFFWGGFSRREKRWIWCVLLLEMAIFLPSPGTFSPQDSKLSRVPPEPYGSHHPAPLFPALITHQRDLTKSSISYVLCHILSAGLSRCCDCKIQTVGLLKAERETGTRLQARERKKALGTSSEE